MDGADNWGNTRDDPQPRYAYYVKFPDVFGGGEELFYDYVVGLLRWSRVWEIDPTNPQNTIIRTGWILCYPSGKPITYADGNQPGQILVSASGSYLTAS